ncbi:hypothetical protein [Foetidibacter luteolus]|uniref:hypothetical protein n=1 Tax=Foetidibacter luteolus TaxID=2608880 RepID=UPI00129B1EDD|nr:hypothetical protein [Foetidibacter luteolus]
MYFFVIQPCFCQQNEDNSDEAKIIERWRPLDFQRSSVPVLKLPKRKNDSPLFCDEMIPYKSGYIINSITSSKGGGKYTVTTSYYYYDLRGNKLSDLSFTGIDTIESIIPDDSKGLYVSYKKSGSRIISFLSAGVEKHLETLAPSDIRMQIDTAKWLKLGYDNGNLYALTPGAVIFYSSDKWSTIVNYSLDEFYVNTLKYKRTGSILPTKNLVIAGRDIWFLQEVVQDRTCLLLKLDTQSGYLSDFFISVDYTDNYFKQINDFMILADSSLLVFASRLMGKSLVLKYRENPEVWIFNNVLKNVLFYQEEAMVATTATVNNDTLLMAATNGIFAKYGDIIVPLVKLENTHQDIKDKEDGLIDFEFIPRSMIKVANNQFLIGGMFGGLYIVDLNKFSIKALDDVKSSKVERMDILSLTLN